MTPKNYLPSPADTSSITLPDTLTALKESLAKNVHEVWAEGRLTKGWKYGPVRDEVKKEHPCLVPYEELTEEEKDFDRATALSTLKFILLKGFIISSPNF